MAQDLTLKCRFDGSHYWFEVVGNLPVRYTFQQVESMLAAVPEPNMRGAMRALVDNAKARPGEWVFLASGQEPQAK